MSIFEKEGRIKKGIIKAESLDDETGNTLVLQ
jgi:hypothetical protein